MHWKIQSRESSPTVNHSFKDEQFQSYTLLFLRKAWSNVSLKDCFHRLSTDGNRKLSHSKANTIFACQEALLEIWVAFMELSELLLDIHDVDTDSMAERWLCQYAQKVDVVVRKLFWWAWRFRVLALCAHLAFLAIRLPYSPPNAALKFGCFCSLALHAESCHEAYIIESQFTANN